MMEQVSSHVVVGKTDYMTKAQRVMKIFNKAQGVLKIIDIDKVEPS